MSTPSKYGDAVVERACALERCGKLFTALARLRRKYCSERCSNAADKLVKYAAARAATAAKRASQCCVDCGAGTGDRGLGAMYCTPCYKQHRNAARRAKLAEAQGRAVSGPRQFRTPRTRVTVAGRPKAVGKRAAARQSTIDTGVVRVARAGTGAKPTVARPKAPVEMTIDAYERPITKAERARQMGTRPNLKGDWFAGWDGCYPPTLSTLERAYLESGVARPLVKAKFATPPKTQWRAPLVECEVQEVAG